MGKTKGATNKDWDIRGRKYVDLVAMKPANARAILSASTVWYFVCTRTRSDGKQCGRTRQLPAGRAYLYRCCISCGQFAIHNRRGKPDRINYSNYLSFMKAWSESEVERYREIIRGRSSIECAVEAVEIVELERKAGLGVCCAKCANNPREHEYDRRRFPQYEAA